jgi:hypothetical protein
MSDISDMFIAAYKNGNLLEVIQKSIHGNWDKIDSITAELIDLHNNEHIDLIRTFSALKNDSSSQMNFFSLRHVLEKSLPELEAPIESTMACVDMLVKEAGQDMAAGTLLPPFTKFCATNQSRVKEALTLIDLYPQKYMDLLPQVIIAGTRLNSNFYLGEALRFAKHNDVNIRGRAIFSLGKIEYAEENDDLADQALSCLEAAAENENDDHLLSGLIDSAFDLYKRFPRNYTRVTPIIEKALQKGSDFTLHRAAILFGSNARDIPDALLECFLFHLLRVKSEHVNTLNRVDYGLSTLISLGNWKGVDFLEKILLANSGKLSVDTFDGVMHECFKNENNLLGRLVVRWFIKGDRTLCESITAIASLAHRDNIQLHIERSDFDFLDPMGVIFLARKSIGYLFATPVTAASIIVSLIRYASDDGVAETLVNLLFDPLTINYPGMVKDYLEKVWEGETAETKERLALAIGLFDKYIEGIKSVGIIPELHPSQSQRDTYNRHFSKLISSAMQEAEKDSVFLSLVSKSVLLYGRKSIDYVDYPNGESNRMEIPLQSHGTTVEFPRSGLFDPFGLDYMLRVFRAE